MRIPLLRRRGVMSGAHIGEVSGAIASFKSALGNAPVKDLTIDIEPVQDLHGQANPWPAGGGKNLCPVMTAKSTNGLTVSVDSNGVISVSGTAQGTGGYITETVTLPKTITSGTTITFGTTTTMPGQLRMIIKPNGSADVGQNSKSVTFNANTDITGFSLYLYTTTGASYNFKVYPQLEIANSASSWSPYSNICPISGWTGGDVVRCGKNLADPTKLAQGFINASGAVVSTATNRVVLDDYICVKDISNVVCSNSANLQYVVFGYDTNKSPIYGSNWKNSGETVDTSAYSWIKLTFREANNADITPSDVTELMVVHGSTASTYTPYSGTTYPISWTSQGTVYGGTLDVPSGVLTVTSVIANISKSDVDHGNIEGNNFRCYLSVNRLSGMKPYGNGYCNKLKVVTSWGAVGGTQGNMGVNDPVGGQFIVNKNTASSVDEMKAVIGDDGLQIVCELATPVTYQLTAHELKTLLGQNNIFCDTGNTSVEYWKWGGK